MCVAVFATVIAYRRPADVNRCSFFSARLLHLKLNTMLLRDDNNMFCDFQIVPATRKEKRRGFISAVVSTQAKVGGHADMIDSVLALQRVTSSVLVCLFEA